MLACTIFILKSIVQRTSDKCSDGTDDGAHAADCVADNMQEAAKQPRDGAENAMDDAVDAVEYRRNRLVDEVHQVGNGGGDGHLDRMWI